MILMQQNPHKVGGHFQKHYLGQRLSDCVVGTHTSSGMGCTAFVSCCGCRSTWRLGRLEDSRTPRDILHRCCRPAERRNHGCAGKKATGKDLSPQPARYSRVPTAEERLAALSLARDLTAADRKNTFKICGIN